MGRSGQRPPPRTDVPPSCGSSTTDPRPAQRSTLPTCGSAGGGDTVVAVPESPRLPWRAVALATVLALAAATATYVLLTDDDQPQVEAGATAGTIELTPEDEVPASGEPTFLTFEGQEVPLSNLQGTPTVVNFFSSTCTPCITEMPAFEEVYQELGGEQVAFLGLAVADRAEDAMALVEQTGVTYPTAQDPETAVFTELGGSVLPTTVLLDADGEVVATHHGELDADELRAFLADELGVPS
jgi:thiol-disulfide isomerase/thioredoxin